jgi:hypothetical protein
MTHHIDEAVRTAHLVLKLKTSEAEDEPIWIKQNNTALLIKNLFVQATKEFGWAEAQYEKSLKDARLNHILIQKYSKELQQAEHSLINLPCGFGSQLQVQANNARQALQKCMNIDKVLTAKYDDAVKTLELCKETYHTLKDKLDEYEGEVKPWLFDGKIYFRDVFGNCWIRNTNGIPGKWAGKYDPSKNKIDASAKEPELE